jgi:hypothetical protein
MVTEERFCDDFPSLLAQGIRFGESVAFGHKSRFCEFVNVRGRRQSKPIDLSGRETEAVPYAESIEHSAHFIRLKECLGGLYAAPLLP